MLTKLSMYMIHSGKMGLVSQPQIPTSHVKWYLILLKPHQKGTNCSRDIIDKIWADEIMKFKKEKKKGKR